MKKKVVVVGSGPGGLTAAMILQHRGFDVQIFEKDSKVGGRNSYLKLGDYKFDIGPTFLMMPYILKEIFSEVGEDLNSY